MFTVGVFLNLLWVGLCIGAALLQLRSDIWRRATTRSRIHSGLAVFLAVVALFPCVSATDDFARLDYLASQTQSQSETLPDPGHDHSLGSLVRLFEILEAAQISVCLTIATTLLLFALVRSIRPRSIDRLIPALSGRAPPSLASTL